VARREPVGAKPFCEDEDVLVRTSTPADAVEIASLLNALLATTTIEWTLVITRWFWWPKTEVRS
jgi:hypothetical protein